MHRFEPTSNFQCCIVQYPALDLYIGHSILVFSARFYISDPDLYIQPWIYISNAGFTYPTPDLAGFIYLTPDLYMHRWIYISDSNLYIHRWIYISIAGFIYLTPDLYILDLYIRLQIYIYIAGFIYPTPDLYIQHHNYIYAA